MSHQFINFAEGWGVEITDLDTSGKLRRCGSTEHPRSKNGSYLFDGERGGVKAWDGDCEWHWWDNPDKQAPTQAERDTWARRKLEREEAQQRLWNASARRSKALMDTCTLKEHNYLHRKGLGEIKGLVLPSDELFVPMYDFVTGDICGSQTIFWKEMEWHKKYMYGSKPAGAALRLGPAKNTEVVLCEGYATGLSIDAALQAMHLKASVLVCFNDSNLINIAKHAPKGDRWYVIADHDKSGAGESAAQATGLNYAMPETEGWDANDLHQKQGLMPLRSLIMKARRLKGTV